MTSLNYGLAALGSQLTGFLFFENVKMERQRTNLPYRVIVPKFLTPRTFINGFFPYGAIQAFSKGFIFGLNQQYIRPYLNYSQTTNNLILGISTGLTEAAIISPILYIKQSIVDVMTTQKLSFFYKGFTFRFLSTGYYTTCLLLFPKIIEKYL